jgi:YggT family protein
MTNPLSQLLVFLLETFLGLFALALLLRFYLQALRAPARNPLYPFLAAVTDWIVVPARRIIPGLWRTDLSTLVLAWVTEVVLLLATFALRGFSLGPALGANLGQILLLAAVEVGKLSLYILMVCVIAQVVVSWVAPYSPAAPLLNSLTRPFLQPLQRRIPPVGNFDLSPLFLVVAIQVLLIMVGWLEGAIVRGLA